jgi:hypothetical protein
MSEVKVLRNDPLAENDAILRDEYYGQHRLPPSRIPVGIRNRRTRKKPKPTHYKVVCISLYTKDIENLEATVTELKKRGYTKANKSQLIRFALKQLDLDALPPPNP